MLVNGHKSANVLVSKNKFLRKIVALGLLNESNTLTETAKQSLPNDVQYPPQGVSDESYSLSWWKKTHFFMWYKYPSNQWGPINFLGC